MLFFKEIFDLPKRINKISGKAEHNRHRINKISEKAENNRKAIKKLESQTNQLYSPIRMFTYLIDHDFTLQQKKWFINHRAYHSLHYYQDLDNPTTFNEKINWYKLHYRDKLITDCIDKYKVKEYVTSKCGKEYVVPLVEGGVFDDVDQVDFEKLPNKFVIKSNWGSGSRHVLIVKDKKTLDLNAAKICISTWIQPWENVYYHTLDWGYKDIEPKIIVEELVEDKEIEYKVFCFYGEPKFLYIAKDSSPGVRNYRDFFTPEWGRLPIKREGNNFPYNVDKPKNLEEILSLSRTLSAPFPHVRVDFMQSKKRLYVEELTFYTGSGEHAYDPYEWDVKLGEYFKLPDYNLV